MAAQANRKPITLPLPRALPKPARMKVENAIEQHLAAVEALTAFLDETYGDENLEPSLGLGFSAEGGYVNDDRELDAGDEPEAVSEDEGADEHYFKYGAL